MSTITQTSGSNNLTYESPVRDVLVVLSEIAKNDKYLVEVRIAAAKAILDYSKL